MTDTSLKCAVLEIGQTARLQRILNCPFLPLLTVTTSNKRTMNTGHCIVISKKRYTKWSFTILNRIICLTLGVIFPNLLYTGWKARSSVQSFPTIKDVTRFSNQVHNSNNFQILFPRCIRINCRITSKKRK